MKRYAYFFLLLALATAARAQAPASSDSLSAKMRYNRRSEMGRVRPAVPVRDPFAAAPTPVVTGADSALTEARRWGDQAGQLQAHRDLAFLHKSAGRSAAALQHMRASQALAGRQPLRPWLMTAEATYHFHLGNYEQAIQTLNRALAFAPPHRVGMRAIIYGHLSMMYAVLGDEPEAARYEHLAAGVLPHVRPIRTKGIVDSIFSTISVLGASNMFRKRWTVSEQYYLRARQHLQQTDQLEYLHETSAYLASAYNWQHKPLLALRYTRPFVAGVLRDTANVHYLPLRLALATAYYENHQPDSAFLHGRPALAQARRIRNKFTAYWLCWALAGAAAEQRDYARAWRYQQLATAYQDSLHVEETGRRADFNRHNTTVARQRARIVLLTKDQELARLRQQRLIISLVLLVVLLAGGVAGAVYLVRQRQRRQEAALRQRLAADLHDEVGSLLTRLSLESSLLSEGLRPPHEQQQQLAQLVSVSQQAQRQLRDVVWSIRPDYDTMPHLLDQMREHGYDLLGAAGLEFDFHADEEVSDTELSTLARQHLYLIYKEALHNAVKHARDATAVLVRLALDGPALRLTVQDDGTGTAAPGRSNGLGLDSMRQRAEAADGAVRYDTAPGQGFTVRVWLPLAGQRLRPAPELAGTAQL